MDPHSFIARAEAQRWIGIAEKLLVGNDFVGSKTFAIRARESDPRLEAADQILAIADTLLAAEKRVIGSNGVQQPDFYAILQLVRFVQDTEHIAAQYRRLAVMLNPHQNRFPYADQAFQFVNEAWAVLSNPLRKSMYDSEIDFPQQQQMNHIGFNLEQHQHQQQQQQQQHQHNFFSVNHMASAHEHELTEPQQIFQNRVQRSHQQQQLQQHNFLSQPNPIRPVPIREQEQLFHQREQDQVFQPQVQPFRITSTAQQQTRQQPPPQSPQPQPPMRPPTASPPAAPAQSPMSWPHAPPPSQPQSMQPQPHPQPQPKPQPKPQLQPQPQQQPQPQAQPQQQHDETLEQNPAPVQFPSQVNSNNGFSEEDIQRETEAAYENVDESPTFWTACPYCLYMYEYPRIYAECTLRCGNCKRAFQAVPISSPPIIAEDQEAYFCCWGFFPLGVSMSHLEKNNGMDTNTNWTPFSRMSDVSSQVQDHFDSRMAKKNRSWGPRVYIDDVTDDIFTGISEPSDDSDIEWNSTRKKKVKRMKNNLGNKKKENIVTVEARVTRSRMGKNLQNTETSIPVQEDVGAPAVPLAESSKKAVASNPRRQSGSVAKELGKLDLNVEFNNNEGEEAAPRMTGGNRGNGQGEEDNIGFFEGLDEFLSSLPILSAVNEEKVKAA